LQILDLSQTAIKEDVNQMLERGMNSVVIQIRNIYFLFLQNITINVYSNLANLVSYQQKNPSNMVNNIPLQILRPPTLSQKNHPTSQTFRFDYATYTNKVSEHELLVFLARQIEAAIINEI
jgi:hypothetical protein